MALPSSIFATPGAVALGVSGVVPEDDHEQAGLQIAWVARTADLAHLKAPCFGMLTVKNKQNSSAGVEGKPIRNGFFVRKILYQAEVRGGGAVYVFP